MNNPSALRDHGSKSGENSFRWWLIQQQLTAIFCRRGEATLQCPLQVECPDRMLFINQQLPSLSILLMLSKRKAKADTTWQPASSREMSDRASR